MTQDNHNSSAPAFLSPKKVAGELGISLTAVYALIQNGDLRALNVAPSGGQGRKHTYRILRVWLDEFVSKRVIQRARPQPQPAVRRRRRRQSSAFSVREYLGR